MSARRGFTAREVRKIIKAIVQHAPNLLPSHPRNRDTRHYLVGQRHGFLTAARVLGFAANWTKRELYRVGAKDPRSRSERRFAGEEVAP